MNEPTEPEPPAPEQGPSSLLGRLTSVFASPGEVFDEIRSRPTRHANWLVPFALASVVGIAYVVVMFSQPRILQQVRDQQELALQKQVDAGSMTEQQKEQALEGLQQFTRPGFMTLMGSFGVVFAGAAMFFAITLGIWLLGRFIWKGPLEFTKAMEIVGLAWSINIFGGLVAMLLMVITGRMEASLSPALLIRDFNASNPVHACLAGLNLFAVWFFAVLSIGLARVTQHPFLKAAAWIFVSWAILKFGTILLFNSLSNAG